MHVVVQALHELDVPVVAVTDFDVLNEETSLRRIVEAFKADWEILKSDWHAIKVAIEGKKPELSTTEVSTEIKKLLDEASLSSIFPESTKKKIQEVLRRASPWAIVKEAGKSAVPNGQPTQACDRLLEALRRIGIYVVAVGQLESFARSVGGHGPSWVNQVLTKDLKRDLELQAAREFVTSFTT